MNNKINLDMETRRIQRNLTNSQRKENNTTREGVIVNNLIKDTNAPDKFSACQSSNLLDCCLHETYDSLLISENAKMPNKLYETEPIKEKSILPICAMTVGVMGALAGATGLMAKYTKQALNLDNAQKLPSLTRNLAVNEETHQALYRIIQSPNKKTILAGVGVLVLTAMAFMGKTFVDGYKDIWVRKKEADIQKNLQDNLIEVETQSFSGKIDIIRGMLSEKAKLFNNELNPNADENKKVVKKYNFGNAISFKKNNKTDFYKPNDENNQKTKKNLTYGAIGIASLASIIGFGYLAMKNLRKSDLYIKQGINNVKTAIDGVIEKSNTRNTQQIGEKALAEMKELDKTNLENMFFAIDADADYIAEKIGKLNWKKPEKDEFLQKIIFNMRKATEKADSAMGGSGKDKPSFYSHVNDYRAFFYNWLIDSKNPSFKSLFFAITGVSGASYVGGVAGEAIKDVQVKKYNAKTELDLQRRLVSTELKNFKSKKDSAIQPLCDEFFAQKRKGKPVSELKVMADNILLEIKNGPPFVYS